MGQRKSKLLFLDSDSIIEVFKFLTRKELCRLELCCRHYANIIDEFFSENPKLHFKFVQNDWTEQLVSSTCFPCARSQRYTTKFIHYSINLFNGQEAHLVPLELFHKKYNIVPKYLHWEELRISLLYRISFFEHRLCKQIFANLQNAIHETTVVRIDFHCCFFCTRKQFSTYLLQKIFPLLRGKKICNWHLRGYHLHPMPDYTEDVPLLELDEFRRAQTLILEIGCHGQHHFYYYDFENNELPSNKGLMFTLTEIMDWLHAPLEMPTESKTTYQQPKPRTRTLKITKMDCLNDLAVIDSTVQTVREILELAKNKFFAASKPQPYCLEMLYQTINNEPDIEPVKLQNALTNEVLTFKWTAVGQEYRELWQRGHGTRGVLRKERLATISRDFL